jgi:uncharacterized Ntn-hydrolase superfamily protein
MSEKPSTFSIVATDLSSGEVGIAVQSKFLAVGAVVSHARAGVGAIAIQANLNYLHGEMGLELMSSAGFDPQTLIDYLLKEDQLKNTRQLGIVDINGLSASFTGKDCFDYAMSENGSCYACQGNILASERVVPAMAYSFRNSIGQLPERMIEALEAGQNEGGDARGMESAHLLIVKPGGGYGGNHDKFIDLRVDHHDDPINELSYLLSLHRLYFERPDKSDLIFIDDELFKEIASLLRKTGHLEEGDDVQNALEDYMGWENLEERWVGGKHIDPKVLDHLRKDAK